MSHTFMDWTLSNWFGTLRTIRNLTQFYFFLLYCFSPVKAWSPSLSLNLFPSCLVLVSWSFLEVVSSHFLFLFVQGLISISAIFGTFSFSLWRFISIVAETVVCPIRVSDLSWSGIYCRSSGDLVSFPLWIYLGAVVRFDLGLVSVSFGSNQGVIPVPFWTLTSHFLLQGRLCELFLNVHLETHCPIKDSSLCLWLHFKKKVSGVPLVVVLHVNLLSCPTSWLLCGHRYQPPQGHNTPQLTPFSPPFFFFFCLSSSPLIRTNPVSVTEVPSISLQSEFVILNSSA